MKWGSSWDASNAVAGIVGCMQRTGVLYGELATEWGSSWGATHDMG